MDERERFVMFITFPRQQIQEDKVLNTFVQQFQVEDVQSINILPEVLYLQTEHVSYGWGISNSRGYYYNRQTQQLIDVLGDADEKGGLIRPAGKGEAVIKRLQALRDEGLL